MNLTFINAQFRDGRIGSLRVRGARIAALDVEPAPADAVIDLQGDRLLPGLINAHDHLQLNSFLSTRARLDCRSRRAAPD
jgi:imidazolonepropionase-like amidohydrolase